jgi:hypothetical protein
MRRKREGSRPMAVFIYVRLQRGRTHANLGGDTFVSQVWAILENIPSQSHAAARRVL